MLFSWENFYSANKTSFKYKIKNYYKHFEAIRYRKTFIQLTTLLIKINISILMLFSWEHFYSANKTSFKYEMKNYYEHH